MEVARGAGGVWGNLNALLLFNLRPQLWLEIIATVSPSKVRRYSPSETEHHRHGTLPRQEQSKQPNGKLPLPMHLYPV
jgi:hypothetical protein